MYCLGSSAFFPDKFQGQAHELSHRLRNFGEREAFAFQSAPFFRVLA